MQAVEAGGEDVDAAHRPAMSDELAFDRLARPRPDSSSRASSALSHSVMALPSVAATPVLSGLRPAIVRAVPPGGSSSSRSRDRSAPSDQPSSRSVVSSSTSHSSHIGTQGCDQAVTPTGSGSTPAIRLKRLRPAATTRLADRATASGPARRRAPPALKLPSFWKRSAVSANIRFFTAAGDRSRSPWPPISTRHGAI